MVVCLYVCHDKCVPVNVDTLSGTHKTKGHFFVHVIVPGIAKRMKSNVPPRRIAVTAVMQKKFVASQQKTFMEVAVLRIQLHITAQAAVAWVMPVRSRSCAHRTKMRRAANHPHYAWS